jgi:hypothetical protein
MCPDWRHSDLLDGGFIKWQMIDALEAEGLMLLRI